MTIYLTMTVDCVQTTFVGPRIWSAVCVGYCNLVWYCVHLRRVPEGKGFLF